ncbi:MAG: hypothetical protein DRP58_11845 [Spirochaetes bacterium]|nr:MAG: hypothetical protein DRP58_11845 [Spirochaetota bacterium]
MKRIVIRVIIVFFFIVSTNNNESLVAAQSTGPAILVKGPVAAMGFPLIYPNAIEVWIGYYRYLDEEVVVSFTRKSVMITEEWENIVCDKLKGQTLENNSFLYKDDSWVILFQFTGEEAINCAFINTFIVRLKYFLRDVSPDSPPLFPAILEIR